MWRNTLTMEQRFSKSYRRVCKGIQNSSIKKMKVREEGPSRSTLVHAYNPSRRLRQEECHEFKPSLNYTGNPCLTKKRAFHTEGCKTPFLTWRFLRAELSLCSPKWGLQFQVLLMVLSATTTRCQKPKHKYSCRSWKDCLFNIKWPQWF